MLSNISNKIHKIIDEYTNNELNTPKIVVFTIASISLAISIIVNK